MLTTNLRGTLTAWAALMALVLLGAGPGLAADAAGEPQKAHPWGGYLTAKEAHAMKTARPEGVLLVDVRDPIEIMFTGFSDVVDVNVPFQFARAGQWNDRRSAFVMERNPDFARGIEAALAEKGLRKTAPVILMCRSGGTRGAPSAEVLREQGFETLYVVSDGFQGDTVEGHPNGPLRIENGWQNSGLPWGWRMNPDKIAARAE